MSLEKEVGKLTKEVGNLIKQLTGGKEDNSGKSSVLNELLATLKGTPAFPSKDGPKKEGSEKGPKGDPASVVDAINDLHRTMRHIHAAVKPDNGFMSKLQIAAVWIGVIGGSAAILTSILADGKAFWGGGTFKALLNGLKNSIVHPIDTFSKIWRSRPSSSEAPNPDQTRSPRAGENTSGGGGSIPNAVQRTIDQLADFKGNFRTEGRALGTAFVSGLTQRIRSGERQARGALVPITRSIESSTQLFNKAGKKLAGNVIAGLVSGIRRGVEAVKRSLRETGEAGIHAMEIVFEVRSPSRVMMRIGRFVASGLAQGIKSGKGQVQAASRDLSNSVTKEAEKTGSSLKDIGREAGGAAKGIKGLGPAGKIAGGGLKAVGTGFKAALGPAGLILMLLEPLISKVIEMITQSETFKKVVDKAMKVAAKAFQTVLKVAAMVIDWVKKNWKKLLPLLLGPVGLVITGWLLFRKKITGAIGAAINWVKKNWKKILAILTGPFGLAVYAIVKNFAKIKSAAGKGVNWVKGKFNALLGFFTSLPGRMSRASSRMFDGLVNAGRGAVNSLIDAWNSLDFGIHVKILGKSIDVGDIIPDIPRLAKGGLVRHRPGGVLALIGEGGEDELVVPMSRLRSPAMAGAVGGGLGRGSTALHVENYYESPRGGVRATAEELMWLAKGRG